MRTERSDGARHDRGDHVARASTGGEATRKQFPGRPRAPRDGNFVRIDQSPRVTPAMAAGVSRTLWSMNDILAMVEGRRE